MAFTLRRGNYKLDWDAGPVLATVIEASRRGMNDALELGSTLGRHVHPLWESETGQLEESIDILDRAQVELGKNGKPQVWGRWGVRDTPREKPDGKVDDVTNKDVAMFLEFGTVKLSPRPWLYQAYDACKAAMPEFIAARYKQVEAGNIPTSIRDAAGRFMSHSILRGGF